MHYFGSWILENSAYTKFIVFEIHFYHLFISVRIPSTASEVSGIPKVCKHYFSSLIVSFYPQYQARHLIFGATLRQRFPFSFQRIIYLMPQKSLPIIQYCNGRRKYSVIGLAFTISLIAVKRYLMKPVLMLVVSLYPTLHALLCRRHNVLTKPSTDL